MRRVVIIFAVLLTAVFVDRCAEAKDVEERAPSLKKQLADLVVLNHTAPWVVTSRKDLERLKYLKSGCVSPDYDPNDGPKENVRLP